MRVDVKKFLFVGAESCRESFFRKAQDFGIVHFINTKPAGTKEVSQDIQDVSTAIKILRTLPVTEQEDMDDFDFTDGIVHKILELKHKLDRLHEERRVVSLDITRVAPFGDFSLDEIRWIENETKKKLQFYCAKEGRFDDATLPLGVIYITSENGLDYFISLNEEPMQFDRMIEMHITHPVKDLKERLKRIKIEIHDIDKWLKGYAKYNRFLHHSLIHKLNGYHLNDAKGYVQLAEDGSLFAIEGWVPLTKIEALHDLTHHLDVAEEEIAIDPEDRIPTYLENEGIARVGEDLVHIYDTPSHTDRDPSLWVLIFFALFFSMIIGDAGYGMILMAIALYINWKVKKKSGGLSRFLKLMMVLSGSIIIWGTLTTSFFGYSFPIDSPVRKVSLMQWLVEKKAEYIITHQDDSWKEWVKKYPDLENVTDPHVFVSQAMKDESKKPVYEVLNKFTDNIMFELALLIGVLHVILSLLRYGDRNISGLGWVAFIIGAYLYLPSYLHATSIIHFVFGVDPGSSARDGMYLMIGGVGFATAVALYKHKLLGLLEPVTVIQIFGDVMSYLRLYALGLAGMLVTATINEAAASVSFVVAALLFIVGHAVNIILGIMGGIIHGLRLNFLEWYHYSFEGGGKKFTPLQKIEIE